jgi:hypothetical protein
MKLLRALTIAALAAQAAALTIGGRHMVVERDNDGLQDIVSIPKFLVERCRFKPLSKLFCHGQGLYLE